MYHEFKYLLLRAQNRKLFCVLNNYKTKNSRSFKKISMKKKIIKRLLGNATGHNDHYMINMGGQRPKIGGN